jgi:hypothetical protein
MTSNNVKKAIEAVGPTSGPTASDELEKAIEAVGPMSGPTARDELEKALEAVGPKADIVLVEDLKLMRGLDGITHRQICIGVKQLALLFGYLTRAQVEEAF